MMFALVVRFDFRSGTEDDLDQLVAEATARIRADEPGTLGLKVLGETASGVLCCRVHTQGLTLWSMGPCLMSP